MSRSTNAPTRGSAAESQNRRQEVLDQLLGLAPLLNGFMIEGLERRRLSLPRVRLLLILFDSGPSIMTELARALDITPRAVTTLVDGLEGTRLLCRSDHPSDRRATVVHLTARGTAMCEELRASYLRWANIVLGPCGDPELAATARVLSQVRTALDKGQAPLAGTSVSGRSPPD